MNKPQYKKQSPKESYQFNKLPPPATPEWKRDRARLQSIGAARLGRGRLVRLRFTLPSWAHESLRRLAAHFNVPRAVVIRCAVRNNLRTTTAAN